MKTLCIVACHTSTELKTKSLVSNIKYFDEISDHIHIINSDEFKDHGIESMLADYPDITYSYIPNDNLVCQGKWKSYLENNDYSDYDKIILTNDSFLILGSLQPIIDASEGFELFGINDSREIKYHITDYFRVYTKDAIDKLLDFYNDKISKFSLVSYDEVVRKLEVESTYAFDDYTYDAFQKIDLRYKKNIFFDDEILENLLDKGFPIVKLRKLGYTVYDNTDKPELPSDFDWQEYKDLHPDLSHFTKHFAELHFVQDGIHEGRPYKVNQKMNYPEYLTKAVEKELSNDG